MKMQMKMKTELEMKLKLKMKLKARRRGGENRHRRPRHPGQRLPGLGHVQGQRAMHRHLRREAARHAFHQRNLRLMSGQGRPGRVVEWVHGKECIFAEKARFIFLFFALILLYYVL